MENLKAFLDMLTEVFRKKPVAIHEFAIVLRHQIEALEEKRTNLEYVEGTLKAYLESIDARPSEIRKVFEVLRLFGINI